MHYALKVTAFKSSLICFKSTYLGIHNCQSEKENVLVILDAHQNQKKKGDFETMILFQHISN